MSQNRIYTHPILKISNSETIEFYWNNKKLSAKQGETIASALIANGIDIFGHHPKDGSPLGVFCANGQCSQCMVLLDGKPIKSCMTKIKTGMSIFPADCLPDIAKIDHQQGSVSQKTLEKVKTIPVLIIGGGPAGLSAAIELGILGVEVLLVDDKSQLGGKLVLQTHRFFGSKQTVYAGSRGIDIAKKLADQVKRFNTIEVWLETTAVGIYEEKTVGFWQVENDNYALVKPEILLVATGARERNLMFKGNTLPGIIGAGAFQTLVNRDLLRPANNLFIVGGGNVGLIAGYHALQAGINVVGVVEALPKCGGYKVHEDKLARLGVPILTSHTIVEATGKDRVESVKIAQVDNNFHIIQSTEKEVSCDSVLIAVGLNPVNEFTIKAQEVGMQVFSAGDSDEIAEASAAMFAGKIKGLEIAKALNITKEKIPLKWRAFESILKSKPGEVLSNSNQPGKGDVFPVIHCRQEIPCDPCAHICPLNLISLKRDDILSLPEFCPSETRKCVGCERCVAICPGLVITLVDMRTDSEYPTVSIPYEFNDETINSGDIVQVTSEGGDVLGGYPIVSLQTLRKFAKTLIIRVKVPRKIAMQVAGIRCTKVWTDPHDSTSNFVKQTDQKTIVCRCEHIQADEIRQLIHNGIRDINQIKAITKATMGACGGKTCLSLIKKIFKEEGVGLNTITEPTQRPLFVEVPLGILAKKNQQQEES